MYIRKAKISELETIMDIYAAAGQFMQSTGNKDQWIDGYPSFELIRNDIQDNNLYLCISKENEVAGVFYFNIGNEDSYLKIYDGKWLNDKPYGVIHRIASGRKQKGIAGFCLNWCFQQINNLRIDTHRNNIIMQDILNKNGFIRCGIIYIENGTERLAFQKCAALSAGFEQ